MYFDKLQGSGIEVTQTNYHLSILINRPENLNTLNLGVLNGLFEVFKEIYRSDYNSSLKVISISGAGEKAFVAGADLKEVSKFNRDELTSYIETGYQAFRFIEECPYPVVALVTGYALGGGLELALACDFILANQNAKFGFPEVNLGLIPGLGGTVRVLKRVPIAIAKKLTMLGDNISAEEAKTIGLIDEIVENEEFDNFAAEFINKLQAKPLTSILNLKDHYKKIGASVKDIRNEVELFKEIFFREDAKEGIKAFLEKRAPQFKD
jgi:enoyl-CoA hydratase